MALSYAEQGTPSTFAVVFVPGPTDSALSYSPVLRHMNPALRCIAVSQRGHGDSDKPQSGYDVRTLADDLRVFLDELGVDDAVLVGHSGSCPVVRRVALDWPDRVAGLVLEASPTSLATHPALADLLSVVRELNDPIDPAFVRSFVTDTSAPDVDLDAFVDEALKVPARAWRGMFEDLATYDDTAELENITAPTLLIWGDGDPLISREVQSELMARIPNARLAIYEGAGHTPRWERPEEFAADVSGLVARP